MKITRFRVERHFLAVVLCSCGGMSAQNGKTALDPPLYTLSTAAVQMEKGCRVSAKLSANLVGASEAKVRASFVPEGAGDGWAKELVLGEREVSFELGHVPLGGIGTITIRDLATGRELYTDAVGCKGAPLGNDGNSAETSVTWVGAAVLLVVMALGGVLGAGWEKTSKSAPKPVATPSLSPPNAIDLVGLSKVLAKMLDERHAALIEQFKVVSPRSERPAEVDLEKQLMARAKEALEVGVTVRSAVQECGTGIKKLLEGSREIDSKLASIRVLAEQGARHKATAVAELNTSELVRHEALREVVRVIQKLKPPSGEVAKPVPAFKEEAGVARSEVAIPNNLRKALWLAYSRLDSFGDARYEDRLCETQRSLGGVNPKFETHVVHLKLEGETFEIHQADATMADGHWSVACDQCPRVDAAQFFLSGAGPDDKSFWILVPGGELVIGKYPAGYGLLLGLEKFDDLDVAEVELPGLLVRASGAQERYAVAQTLKCTARTSG